MTARSITCGVTAAPLLLRWAGLHGTNQVTKEARIPGLLIKIQHNQLESMGVSKEAGQDALNRYARITAARDEAARQKMDDFTHA